MRSGCRRLNAGTSVGSSELIKMETLTVWAHTTSWIRTFSTKLVMCDVVRCHQVTATCCTESRPLPFAIDANSIAFKWRLYPPSAAAKNSFWNPEFPNSGLKILVPPPHPVSSISWHPNLFLQDFCYYPHTYSYLPNYSFPITLHVGFMKSENIISASKRPSTTANGFPRFRKKKCPIFHCYHKAGKR